MKFLAALTAFACLAAAAPAELDTRQLGSSTATDLEKGQSSNCPSAILIFARGSTETGNMGMSVGTSLSGALKKKVSGIWIQGVGGPYTAGLGDNALPRGSSAAAIKEGVRLMNLAHEKCPNAAILTGGYSQGSALIAAAITDLDATVREQVKGAALFGYTQNKQNKGQIPSFPADRTKVFCASGDLVCEGSLIVAAPHFTYGSSASGEGADFLAGKVSS
ncbi:unnamed protein product [Clonostachys rosea f. rosea IK726]|uniref:cutinase n=2 Tax=Bionectria ochroleuca TaxID=29856 RepID=A0A0B7JVP3_BIOOC|nr:unnamed protein product [Clonostachys rosea f. rosea IK726]